MSVQLVFDGRQYDPNAFGSNAETVLDAGKYLMQVMASERKPVAGDATNTKSFLAIECAVVSDGPFKGVRKTLRFNCWNDNPKAVQLALSELSALSHAVGIPQWTATGQLHGKIFGVEFDKVPNSYTDASGNKRDSYNNNAKGYYDQHGRPMKEILAGLGGGPTPAAPAAQAAPQATAGPGPGFNQPAAAAPAIAPVPSGFGPQSGQSAAAPSSFGPQAGAAPAGFGTGAPAADAPQWR